MLNNNLNLRQGGDCMKLLQSDKLVRFAEDAFDKMIDLKKAGKSEWWISYKLEDEKQELICNGAVLLVGAIKAAVYGKTLKEAEDIKKMGISYLEGKISSEDEIKLRIVCTEKVSFDWRINFDLEVDKKAYELILCENYSESEAKERANKLILENICSDMEKVTGIKNADVHRICADIIMANKSVADDGEQEKTKKMSAMGSLQNEYKILMENPQMLQKDRNNVVKRFKEILADSVGYEKKEEIQAKDVKKEPKRKYSGKKRNKNKKHSHTKIK